MKKCVLTPISLFFIGLVLGVIGRLLDIYTQNLGNMFSQMAIWILFGVLISIYSKTKKQAMRNILPFCIGMLVTYYFVAFISKGVFPKIISIGIVLVSIVSSVILFDGLRVYDFIINGFMIYYLFFRKIER